MHRLKRNTACYPLVQVFLFQTRLRATYLVSSHSVAWSKFYKATVGVPHAVNAVSCFKASDLEKKISCALSVHLMGKQVWRSSENSHFSFRPETAICQTDTGQTCIRHLNNDVTCWRWSYDLPRLICGLLHELNDTNKTRAGKLSSKLMTRKCMTSKYFNLFNLLPNHFHSLRSS